MTLARSWPYDRRFLIALALGPFAWLLLLLFSGPARSLPQPGMLLPVVVYPVLEEIVFRGGVQGWLSGYEFNRSALFGFSSANWLTSLLFVAAHLFAHSPLWALSVLLPSLLFGFFRDAYRSILPGIALHVFYNAGFFLLLAQG